MAYTYQARTRLCTCRYWVNWSHLSEITVKQSVNDKLIQWDALEVKKIEA